MVLVERFQSFFPFPLYATVQVIKVTHAVNLLRIEI